MALQSRRMLMVLVVFAGMAMSLFPSEIHAEQKTEMAIGTLKVMTFNVRYGLAKDGVNHWSNRRDRLVETIQAFDPDLLGTQETLGFQKDYIAEKCPQFGWFGVGREDGKDKGEMTAIFYKKSRFEKLDGGHFWLSETPEVVGSKSWDSSLPRMVSWVKLKDRQADAGSKGGVLYFFDTHFDHRGDVARVESSKLIRQKMAEIAGDTPTILTGDFNAAENSGPYKALFTTDDQKAETSANGPAYATLLDVFRLANPKASDEEGTASGFVATQRKGARIDWIAVTPDFDVIQCEINHTEHNGQTPSDHFPVQAVLKLK